MRKELLGRGAITSLMKSVEIEGFAMVFEASIILYR